VKLTFASHLDKQTRTFSPGDVLNCSTPSSHGYRQSYKWADNNGVIVSNSSTMTLTGEGSFNLTCTITDERPACSVRRASISGIMHGKLIQCDRMFT